MADLSRIIKVTQTQYDTLASGSSIEKGGTTYTYDANAMYLVEQGAVGSSSQPIYINNNGEFVAGESMPTTTTANKVLLSTTTSGTKVWSSWSSAGFLKTNTSGVVSVDTTSYLPTSGGNYSVSIGSASSGSNKTLTVNGKVVVNPSYNSATNSFNEGVRINQASNGWANVHFGGSASSSSSTGTGCWLCGRRGENGSKSGATGDFTIEHNSSTGTGLTLYANGNRPTWNGNSFAYSSDLSSYLPLSGGKMTGSIKYQSSSLPQKTLQYIMGIDAFASGGESGWMSKDDFLAGCSKTGHTHSYLPLSGGAMTGVITGAIDGKGIVLKSTDKTGSWSEGVYILDNVNNYSVLTLGNSDKSDLLAFVHNGNTNKYYMETRVDGGSSKVIDIPNKAGTLALTSDIPSSLPANGGRADYLNGMAGNHVHPGHGLCGWYSWGQTITGGSGYAVGLTVGSHPSDQAYGFEICENLWDDRLYTRRYSGGWQSWYAFAYTSDLHSQVYMHHITISGNVSGVGSFFVAFTLQSTSSPAMSMDEVASFLLNRGVTYTSARDYSCSGRLEYGGIYHPIIGVKGYDASNIYINVMKVNAKQILSYTVSGTVTDTVD